jgi:hypothetical protein
MAPTPTPNGVLQMPVILKMVRPSLPKKSDPCLVTTSSSTWGVPFAGAAPKKNPPSAALPASLRLLC